MGENSLRMVVETVSIEIRWLCKWCDGTGSTLICVAERITASIVNVEFIGICIESTILVLALKRPRRRLHVRDGRELANRVFLVHHRECQRTRAFPSDHDEWNFFKPGVYRLLDIGHMLASALRLYLSSLRRLFSFAPSFLSPTFFSSLPCTLTNQCAHRQRNA